MEKEERLLSLALCAPVEESERPGGDVRLRPARAYAFKVELPEFFDAPEIVDLFARGFTGKNEHFQIDPDEMRTYTRDHVQEPGFNGVPHWLQFWVVWQEEFCGFIIASYSPWPQCQNCVLLHMHADKPGVSEVLITKAFGWAMGYGLTKISICNGSGKKDDVYMRWFRKFGRGTVRGSVMDIDLEDRHG